MLAIAAAVLFFIAWILHITETAVDEEFFGATSLMFLGLTLLALHLAGVLSSVSAGRRTSRRR